MSTQEEPKRDVIVEIRYSSYTPAQKRATQKYRNDNKDKVNEQRKKYYQARKESDPGFLEYKRAKAKEYYNKAKQRSQNIVSEIPQPDAPVADVVGVLSSMSHPEGTTIDEVVLAPPDEVVLAPPDEEPVSQKPAKIKVICKQRKTAVV